MIYVIVYIVELYFVLAVLNRTLMLKPIEGEPSKEQEKGVNVGEHVTENQNPETGIIEEEPKTPVTDARVEMSISLFKNRKVLDLFKKEYLMGKLCTP